MLRKARRNRKLLKIAGYGVYYYLRFVRLTCRLTVEPAGSPENLLPIAPAISAMWHGQHFLAPYTRPPGLPVDVMISRSADGEINAVAASAFGIGLIRASGARRASDIIRKGGHRGFREALQSLSSGRSVAMTADIPNGPARTAGPGIVVLAQISGRPIIPMAVATSRRRTLNSWDKATLNLPFGRMAIVYGEPIHVPDKLPKSDIATWCRTVEKGLNDATRRAYAIVDGNSAAAAEDTKAGAIDDPSVSESSENA